MCNQATADDTTPIEQSRRLSLRRPSFNMRRPSEVTENENFIDIKSMLKPVVKDKATPQKAEKSASQLTKVTDAIHGIWMRFNIIT